jgi:hypothetical protein
MQRRRIQARQWNPEQFNFNFASVDEAMHYMNQLADRLIELRLIRRDERPRMTQVERDDIEYEILAIRQAIVTIQRIIRQYLNNQAPRRPQSAHRRRGHRGRAYL